MVKELWIISPLKHQVSGRYQISQFRLIPNPGFPKFDYGLPKQKSVQEYVNGLRPLRIGIKCETTYYIKLSPDDFIEVIQMCKEINLEDFKLENYETPARPQLLRIFC